MARKQTRINISAGNFRGFGKAVNALVAKEREKVMRGRCIAAAKLARDAIADNAPSSLFTRLLQSEKLEREYNKNPGYDMKMEAGAKFSFVLKLSTNRFPASRFGNYNPVWGMIVSNYGRRAIDVAPPSAMPIPVDSSRDAKGRKLKRYNHPRFGTGYNGMYSGRYVKFTTHVDAVQGTGWMEEGLRNAHYGIKAILKGDIAVSREVGMDRGARRSKSDVL